MDAVKEITTPEDQQALIQGLNDLINDNKGIDEALAKQLRKRADEMAVAAQGTKSKLDDKLSEEIVALLAAVREKTHKQVARRNADFKKVITMLDEADQSLKNNQLKAAEESVHRLLSILGTIPGLSDPRRQKIDKRLNRIQPQMRKLESWRHWGTSQARTDLIAQIKLLVGSQLHPKEIAKTIDAARTQWQHWDKGGDHSKRELWLAFDQACKQAFKPCKVYFDERKQTRKKALEEKRGVIQQLNERFASTDWKTPDYKGIDKWVRAKRRDFFKTASVDYKDRKKITQALDEAVAQFETQLGRERTRCYKSRQKLVDDVQSLAALEDSKAAVEQLETLKKQWLVTVIEKRTLEDKLWKKYQAACDIIYNKRNSARKQQDAEFGQNLKTKHTLLEQLDQIAALEPAEMLAERAKFLQLLDQYKEIGYVPRQHEKPVQNRLNQTKKQFEKKAAVGEQTIRQQNLKNQFSLASLSDEIEQAVIAQKDTTKLAAQWHAMADKSTVPKPLSERFNAALKASEGAGFSDQELASNLEAKQAHCLKLEVCYDLDSPAEFQKQRMAYQIERLSASMKKSAASQDQPEQLINHLLSIGAIPADQAAAISSRIETCFNRHTQS